MTPTFQLRKPDLCGRVKASGLTTAPLCRVLKYAAPLASSRQTASRRLDLSPKLRRNPTAGQETHGGSGTAINRGPSVLYISGNRPPEPPSGLGLIFLLSGPRNESAELKPERKPISVFSSAEFRLKTQAVNSSSGVLKHIQPAAEQTKFAPSSLLKFCRSYNVEAVQPIWVSSIRRLQR